MWFIVFFAMVGDQPPIMNWAADKGFFKSQEECETALTARLLDGETVSKNAAGALVSSNNSDYVPLYAQCIVVPLQ